MKKTNFNIIAMISVAVLTLGVGIGLVSTNQNAYQEAAAAESIAYTISFAYNASGNDSTTAYTTSNFLTNAFSSGSEYISSVTETDRCYMGGSNGGMKFGSSEKKGYFSLALAPAGQVAATKLVINAKSYGTDSTSFYLNDDKEHQTLTTTFADYTFTLDGSTLTSISFDSANAKKSRGYISSISVYTNESTAALSSIAATSQPSKTVYKIGESFDPSGMVITAYYDDSSSHAISEYVYSPDGPLSLSDTTITITYVESDVTKTTTVDISIITLSSIAISGDMSTKSYNVGNSWNYSGLTVTATYSDASTEDVTSDVMWTADPSTATSVSITSISLVATYDGKTASQTVNGISVTTVSTIGGIVSGKQYLLTATGSDGNTYILKAGAFSAGGSGTYSELYTSLSNYSASDAWTFTTNETDDQWIISGSDGSTTFALHNKTTNNGVVSASSGSVAYEATYADESSNTIYLMDISNSRYLTVYPTNPDWRCYTSTTAQGIGSQITLIEYTQKVVNYISVTTMPEITSYDLSDALDTTGLVITATYSDSSSEDVTSGCTYSPTVLSTAGTQTITVTHTGSGKTTSFDVTVSSVTITSI
ncbi:MAG: bacterial Ig-like domain-containing protein, partial [Bacilli bacterium]